MATIWKMERVEDIDRCKNCKYFYQHYVKLSDGFKPCEAGHCVNIRVKGKNGVNRACDKFTRV